MKKFLLFFYWLCAAPLWAAGLLDEIKERGVLRVGIHQNALPFSFLDASNQRKGIDIEIAKELAKSLLGDEQKIEWIEVRNQDRIPLLKEKRADIVIANFTKTQSRSRLVDFAQPYARANLSLVSKKSALVRSLTELEKQTVIVKKGSTAEKLFLDLYPLVVLHVVNDNQELFDALSSGKGVAAAHDNILLWGWLNKNTDFAISIPAINDESFIAPAVDKNQKDLLTWVNQEMTQMKEDGRLKTIYQNIVAPIYGESKIEEMYVK